jgi:hypothetical protein
LLIPSELADDPRGDAPPPPTAVPTAVETWIADLSSQHEKIIQQVADVVELGERGVFASGQLLGEMVREALSHGESMEQTLASARAGQIAAELGKEATSAKDHVGRLDRILTNLVKGASEAMVATANVRKRLPHLRRISGSMRVLETALRIEIANVSGARDVSTIVEQLHSLSGEIESLSSDIETFTETLTTDLPSLMGSADRVRRAREAVSGEVARSISTLETVTTTLAATAAETERMHEQSGLAIRHRCEDALSRMQFFDPMAQSLQTVDALIAQVLTSAASAVGIAKEFRPTRFDERLGDREGNAQPVTAPAAGEVMLF